MKFGLVLSGGAARGAFHLGILHFLEEHSINIHAYSGSSIGAIISVSHASGVSAKEQLKIYNSAEFKKVLKFNYFKNGLIKIDTNHKILNELLPIKDFEKLPKEVYVNAYDIKRGELHYFNKGDTHTLCMASSALVPLFKPISYEKMYLIDGGLIDNLPIKPFLDDDYHICSVDLMPRQQEIPKKKIFNPFKSAKKKIFSHRINNMNYSIKHSHQYITTQKLRNFKMFTFKELNDCFNLGYKESQKHFLDIL